ncbi:hypothetical protein [Dongia deserti]|uniref:hypothetical protein n=1 Tax=Dongia deserti TaxID=2268030 RepID=UPI000E656248|nr:hypothetical protein [Dongia deserti]
MTIAYDEQEREWSAQSEQNPFAESLSEARAEPESAATTSEALVSWNESLNPFSETLGEALPESEADRLLNEAFAEFRDEGFDEAVSMLAEETEQAVGERFIGESPSSSQERERYADAQLAPVRFEAQQYLEALEAGLSGMEIGSLSEAQLAEVLDRFDPQTGELTPAGEEFVGAIVRKAKKVVNVVANTAKSVGKIAGKMLGPVLQKLRGLINPLLRRVLAFAIGRLPAALQPVARTLAAKITSEAEAEDSFDEAPMSPANLSDVEALSESFDAALAEALVDGAVGTPEADSFDTGEDEADMGGRELETLAQERGVLIDRLRAAGDDEGLAPDVEQFVPALLGALRLGVKLIGRPKVVRFLAKYLDQAIRRWVGPAQSGPLSNAIVDTGLRLVSLESESSDTESLNDEAAPVALASVIEDTVRRVAESEDYVLDNEDLLQLAAAEAFGAAVATHFPAKYVKPALQQAPSIGGTFIAKRPRSVRTYRKYSRVPEVDVTAQIADALPTFGGATLGAVMRAAGATFPIRARMHIYQSAAGTTLPRMVRLDRANASGRGYVTTSSVHPLTPAAAGMLLREPQLGVAVPPAFLRSRNRIAVGQRFYVLEPMGAAGALALPVTRGSHAAGARLAPSRAWITANLRKSRVTVGFYLSEVESQGVVEAIRQGRGGPALLKLFVSAYRAINRGGPSPQAHIRVVREDGEAFEELAARAGHLPAFAALRRRLRGWVLPALAAWVRTNGEAFARAASHPEPGVTVRMRLTSVPGLESLANPRANAARGAPMGTPTIAITVKPGRPKS